MCVAGVLFSSYPTAAGELICISRTGAELEKQGGAGGNHEKIWYAIYGQLAAGAKHQKRVVERLYAPKRQLDMIKKRLQIQEIMAI